MTDDLVKRLHESAQAWDNEGECGLATLEREAADRIEKLEATLREIASGKYSSVVLTTYPPQDPAVVQARAALGEKKDV